MSLIVGVDAGGTMTKVVVERDRAIAGSFEGESSNVRRAGAEAVGAIVARAVESATQGARVDALVVGAAGAGHPRVASELQTAIASRIAGANVRVVDDASIALRAAVPQGDGIVVIAGTGSIAYALIGEQTYRSGGYGFLLGDEGSGAALGSAAVRSVLRAYDGRSPRDGFVEAMEAVLDADTVDTVIDAIYGAPDPIRKLASLAPTVLACGSDGERSATKLVQAAALDLADLLKSVVRRAKVAERELPVVLAGGMLANNSLLTYLLETRIANEYPHFTPMKNPPSPEYGALAMARAMVE